MSLSKTVQHPIVVLLGYIEASFQEHHRGWLGILTGGRSTVGKRSPATYVGRSSHTGIHKGSTSQCSFTHNACTDASGNQDETVFTAAMARPCWVCRS